MEEDNQDLSIEKAISLVGYGKYQIRFACFGFCVCLILTLHTFGTYQVMGVPDHWCHVPRPPTLSNMSAHDWKTLTIPKKNNTYKDEFEKCYMYNLTNFSLEGAGRNGIIKCQDGWEYDKTWFTSTIPSQENWVCDQQLRRVNFLYFIVVADIVGQAILGYLGDKYGRRRMYLVCVTLLGTGRIGTILLLPHFYPAFVLFGMMARFPNTAITNILDVIGLELSSPSSRSKFNFLLYLGHISGELLNPLMYWAIGSWLSFYLMTSATFIGLVLSHRLLVESPRWLIARRKTDECLRVLQNICKYNGSKFSEEITQILKANSNNTVPEVKKRRVDNLMTWKMTRLFCLTLISWSTAMLTNSIQLFTTYNMGGNPHVNFIFYVVSEIPGVLIGKYLSDIIGRRFTRAIFGVLITLSSFVIVFLINKDSELPVKVSWLVIKVFSTGVLFVTQYHTIEVFPSSIRQTGLATSSSFGAFLASLSPHIIYLGTIYDKRIPHIITISLGILQAVAAILMPETLGITLPATVADTENLMKEQKFWAIPKKREQHGLEK